jgi:hypothetical protein
MMSLASFKQRSSWPSSFLTGLIGWNGFFIIVALALRYARSAGVLFVAGSLAAVLQVSILRLAFFPLRLDRSKLAGFICGGATGAILILVEMRLFPLLNEHFVIWLINGTYIGIAVGLFLSYFYRDDRRIEAEAAAAGQPFDYGRDAHWLEPFVFGAVAYLVIFLPRSFDLAVTALMIGAMSGVVAAGVSHFFLFAAPRQSALPILLSVIAGLAQGAASGLLFRPFSAELLSSPLTHGALAGVLTYLLTAFRGRTLARHELEAGDEG